MGESGRDWAKEAKRVLTLAFLGGALFGAVVVAVIATLLASCATAKPAPGYHREPRGASVSPRLGVGETLVLVRVWIDDPTPDMFCPAMEITLDPGPLGTAKGYEHDCPPFDEDTTGWSESRWYRVGPGHHEFVIQLTQGKKVLTFGPESHSLYVDVR